MVSTESPAVARRRVRLALRRAREAKGLTQGQVADALDWSLSKVNRIEKGDVTVSSTDLRALLSLLGVDDAEVIERLTADARTSRRRGWWDEPRYREHLSSSTLQLLQFEGEANAIRSFHPTLIPGLLQTRTYAEAVLDFWSELLNKADRTTRLEVRLHRAKQVFDRPDPPLYLVILDESVVMREVGGPQAMADQLRTLLAASRHPAMLVRVLPLAAGVLSMLGQFTIFDLGDEENAILYREHFVGDEILHTADAVQRYRQVFERMWEQSLSEEASARLIEARAAGMLSSLDRLGSFG